MRLRFIKILSVFFCLIAIFSLAAMEVFAIPTIKGKVVLKGTGASLPNIWVKWMEDYGTPYQSAYRFYQTDNNGIFNFVDLSTLPSGKEKKLLGNPIDTNIDGVNDDVEMFVDFIKPIPGYPGGTDEFFHFNAANSPHAFTAVVPSGLSGTFNIVSPVTINDADPSLVIPDIEFTPLAVSTTPTPPPIYSISGNVFNDDNKDGNLDKSEKGYSGATIILSGDVSATANSDAKGDYSFKNLVAGTYTAAIVVPVGKNVTTASSQNINLTKNQTGFDFGLANAVINAGCTASITGTVYNDLGGNGDGVLNAGDVPISGWTVHLSAGGLPAPLTTTTNGSGVYTFTGLCTGIFTLTQTILPPWVSTGLLSMNVNVIDGNVYINKNFFDAQQFTISGHALKDPNGDGILTDGSGFGGVTVILVGTTASGPFPPRQVTTPNNGLYTFTNLPVGSYKLIFGQVVGYRSTTANALNIDLINNQTIDYGLTPASYIEAGGVCDSTTLDIVLVIDHSESMSEPDPAGGGVVKIDEAKEAASAFVDIIMQNLPTARIGIVQFSDSDDFDINNVGNSYASSLLLPLTGDANQLKTTISNISLADDTCVQCGVRLANKALNDGTRPNSQKMIILLTDGLANQTADDPGFFYTDPSYPEDAAMEDIIDGINQQNIIYNTIGLGTGSAIDELFLQAIANTNGGSYYNDPTNGDLEQIFTDIALESVPTGAITGMVYNDKDISATFSIGDTPIANMPIVLNGANLPAALTATSDSNGNYGFYGLCESDGENYTVTQSTISPWLLTTTGTYTITVAGGATYKNNNFGNRYGYQISGSVFNDINKNHIKDAGEQSYSGGVIISASTGTVITKPDGTYTINGLLAGNVLVSYTSPLPTGFILIYPGPPAIFNVTPGPGCSVNGSLGAVCDGGGNITNLNFAISNSIPWWQTYGLDVRMENSFDNPIPTTADAACGGGSYASGTITGSFDSPGIIFSGDGSAEFGQGFASSVDWKVGGGFYPELFESAKSLKTSMASLLAAAAKAGITVTQLSSCSNNCNLSPQSGFYHILGDWVSDKNETFSGGNHIFVSDGTITFTGDRRIRAINGATVIFSAKNIVIGSSRGEGPTCSPIPEGKLQGIFSADNNITVEGNNGDCTTGADKMLNIEGTFIANAARGSGKFKNNRDLCGDNLKYPSITIKARPDFILNIPGFMTEQNIISQEETP